MKNIKKRKKTLQLIGLAVGFVLIIAFAVYFIALNIKRSEEAKVQRVKGIDVSAYQGDIDWKEIEKQDIKFAYIKATEGVDYVDEKFESNWKNIDSTGIRKGAYFYYIFDDNANEMADHFINTVEYDRNALPPVIDIELTGEENPVPEKDKVIKNISTIIDKFKNYYKVDPIIYTNHHTFETYFVNDFKDIKFWIANINVNDPKLKDHEWVFWQYTFRNVLNGIGEESLFVDGDLYDGNLQQFNDEFKKGWF